MCYSAIAVANFFIEKSQKTKVSVSNMHLQKMIFFAHAAFFKENGKPLFSDPVFAWQHGPVVESVYWELKKYGNKDVSDFITMPSRCKSSSEHCRMIIPIVPESDYDTVDFLNHVWQKLSCVETWRLRALSHAEGGAWYETVYSKKINPMDDKEVAEKLPRNLTILDEVIQRLGR